MSAALEVLLRYKKSLISAGILLATAGALGRVVYNNRATISAVVGMYRLYRNSSVQPPSTSHLRNVSFPLLKLQSIADVRRSLNSSKDLSPTEKSRLWEQLKVEIFTQTVYNIYVSVIYELSFFMSYYIASRDSGRSLVERHELAVNSLKANAALLSFIRAHVTCMLQE